MRILNYGSLNLDHVYDLPHIVAPGETSAAASHEIFLGGKGFNQSVALARAGAQVWHVGALGRDGEPFRLALENSGVHTGHLWPCDAISGHAIIQLGLGGQNAIIIYGGANLCRGRPQLDAAIACFGPGDMLLVQNEVADVAYAIRCAKAQGMQVAFNPSPVSEALPGYPLELVDVFLLNEIEGVLLAGAGPETPFDAVLELLHLRFPDACIVLTVGSGGVLYAKGGQRLGFGIYDVPVVDTTGAGDTFCGYFLAAYAEGMPPQAALALASKASSLAVAVRGASDSIPSLAQVQAFKGRLCE